MPAQDSIQNAIQQLLQHQGLVLVTYKPIQSLWAGYGQICRVTARRQENDNQLPSVALILKYISPPTIGTQTGTPNEGHIRKILSYQIEQYFYTRMVPQMPAAIGIAACIASSGSAKDAGSPSTMAMMLEDLSVRFPVAGERRAELTETQVLAAIRWLAQFHGFWWTKADDLKRTTKLCLPPLKHYEDHETLDAGDGSVWLNGGYTYLATRMSEYASLAADSDSEWSEMLCSPTSLSNNISIATAVAKLLSPGPEHESTSPLSEYITLIHGDVKSENLFTTQDGKDVAFFDFQYVGLGLGVCDLAKLFTCSVPLRLLGEECASESMVVMEDGEERLLRFYVQELEKASGKRYDWNVFRRHWETALVDWLRFQASWGFWGNTEWLKARGRSILNDDGWIRWVEAST